MEHVEAPTNICASKQRISKLGRHTLEKCPEKVPEPHDDKESSQNNGNRMIFSEFYDKIIKDSIVSKVSSKI